MIYHGNCNDVLDIREIISSELVAAENAAATSNDNQQDEQYKNSSDITVAAENSRHEQTPPMKDNYHLHYA